MTDFRRFPKTEARQLIDYNRFVSLTGEKLLICLDRGVIEIARYLLNSRGSWRTTYVKEYVGTIGYTMPTVEEFELVLHAIAESNEDMSSCEDVVTELAGIKEAILSTATSGSGGCGCVIDGGQDLTDVNDVPPTSEGDREGPPPDGSASWEIYDQHKCNWATKWLDDYIATLNNYGGLFGMLGGLTVAIIVGLTLLTVPPVGLALLMSALGLLLTVDVGLFASFTTIATYFSDNKSEIACEMVEAETTADMITALSSRITSAVATVPALPPGVDVTLEQACNALISNASLQGIIDNGGLDPIGYLDSECCEEEDTFFIDLVGGLPAGTLTDGNMLTSGTIESATIDVFGAVRQLIICTSTGEPQDNYFRIDNVISDSGSVGYVLDVYDDSLTLIDHIETSTLSTLEGYESEGTRQFHIFDAGDDTSSFIIEFSWSTSPF